MQEYLQAYAEQFGLVPRLRLNTEVIHARQDAHNGSWTLRTRNRLTGADNPAGTFGHLVVANGIFSDPLMPDFAGVQEFAAAGGRVHHTSAVHELEEARNRHVVVVGYGKSSCDIAAALDEVSASTSVVARHLLWKIPRRFAGLLNHKHLLLTRLGEGLFRYISPVGVEKFLHGPGRPVRNAMLGGLQSLITHQLGLRRLGLVLDGSLETIARSTVSLVTEDFYEKVAAGTIQVHPNTEIARLTARDGFPAVELTDGTVVRADLVVCGTGFQQRVPFLDQDVQDRLRGFPGGQARLLADLRAKPVQRADRLRRVGIQGAASPEVVRPRLGSTRWVDVAQRDQEVRQGAREGAQVADPFGLGRLARQPPTYRPRVGVGRGRLPEGDGDRQLGRQDRQSALLLLHGGGVVRGSGQAHGEILAQAEGAVVPPVQLDRPEGQMLPPRKLLRDQLGDEVDADVEFGLVRRFGLRLRGASPPDHEHLLEIEVRGPVCGTSSWSGRASSGWLAVPAARLPPRRAGR